MANDLLVLARMAAALPDELVAAQRRGVAAGALIVTRGIRAEIREATGGDNRLSGVGRRGARVGARYTVLASTRNPVAIIAATGPMQLLEHDTAPHPIRARGTRTPTGRARRRRGAKALHLANGRFAANARHPGTTAKRPFEKGYLRTRDKTGPAYDREVQKAIRKALSA